MKSGSAFEFICFSYISACSKIKELNDTVNELKEEINDKPGEIIKRVLISDCKVFSH